MCCSEHNLHLPRGTLFMNHFFMFKGGFFCSEIKTTPQFEFNLKYLPLFDRRSVRLIIPAPGLINININIIFW